MTADTQTTERTPMQTINIEKMRAEIEAHIAADAVRGGHYWDGETGCFIGCLAHSADAAELQRRYGLPLPFVRLCEVIFEGLPASEQPVFFREVGEAVDRDGRDLSRVHWAFLADALRHLPRTGAQDVVDRVIVGMDLLAAGEQWPDAAAVRADTTRDRSRATRTATRTAALAANAARAAALASHAAAAAATAAAADAASAVWAASAPRNRAQEIERQRRALLDIIRAAPDHMPGRDG